MGIVAGTLLGLLAAFIVVQPLLHAASGRAVPAPEPLFTDSDDEDDPALARRDRALAALKEIDFDKATGKLSDPDYDRLKAQFTTEALDALRDADVAAAPAHSATDDAAVEALIASARGSTSATRRFCVECGASMAKSLKFCVECGASAGALRP